LFPTKLLYFAAYLMSPWDRIFCPVFRPVQCPYVGISFVSVSSSCILELHHKTSISLHQLSDPFICIPLLVYTYLGISTFFYAILLAYTHVSWRVPFAGSSLYMGRTFITPRRIWVPHSSLPVFTQWRVQSPDTHRTLLCPNILCALQYV
jgi:hypothetical protein